MVDIQSRIRFVRKDYLGLSQEEFGKALGVSRDVIKNIELGLLAKPEQKVPLYKLICATYGVDYHWLTTGEGEMIYVSDDALADRIEDLLEGENETAKAIFKALAAFDESDWKIVQKFIDALKKDEAD